jgi:outer membrane receptor protein involved in Fe transport
MFERVLRSLSMAAVVHAGVALADTGIEEVIVLGSIAERQGDLGSMSAIDAEALEMTRATHPSEALVRVPGVWISRGSGQEHLTAIRSPVFTGPGSCGEFLLLENGVPIRPTGFCNVNNLFEINTEQAQSIEVLRGAASAVFGGNALYGTINVVSAAARGATRVSLEGGPDDYGQARVSASVGSDSNWLRADAQGTSTNGYRDATGHDEQKLNLTHATRVGEFDVRTLLAATNLNQETGGFVLGYKAYEKSSLRRSNPNPEAYRDAWALRLTSDWRRDLDNGRELSLTPYLRKSSMQFLQHFLPGQPLERNGQTSAGLQVAYAGGESTQWQIGAMAEWADGDLYEFQRNATQGSPFLQATRPVGVHYDYDVRSLNAAAFYDVRVPLSSAVDLVHSARLEWLEYDYDNNGLDGNTRDDGTPCGFGGCLYTRPSDRSDDFVDVAGRVGLDWRMNDLVTSYALLSSGFRAPQATELYRLQSGQAVADLDSERITTAELGLRFAATEVSGSAALYLEKSADLVLRDANGFNISRGKIDSAGIEIELRWTPVAAHAFELATTYARHQYAFDRVLAQGETIEDGNDVDTAPRWLGSARWQWQPIAGLTNELEVVYVGEHFVNAENTAEYDGHALWNWRTRYRMNDNLVLFARVMNLASENYADRADFAFGNYRYFPGTPLQLFAGFEFTF